MKKIIALTAAAALAITMAACSSSADSETSVPTTQSTTGSTTGTTSEITTVPSTVPSTTEPAFKEIVLVEDDNATVKIIGIEEDDLWGYTLKVFIENKTDKELMFTVDKVSVNGFMCDPFWAATVDAGMKANEEISFSENDFEKNGIESVESITLTLRAYDNDNWISDDIVNETITIKP